MHRLTVKLCVLFTFACGAKDTDPCTSTAAEENVIHFTEVAASANITHVQSIARPVVNCPVVDDGTCAASMTGGAAAADFDNDGWPDLAISRWNAPLVLHRNLHDGTFADVATAVGVNVPAFSNGLAWADIDGDADLDLFVTTIGDTRFYLFVNGLAQQELDSTGLPRFREQAIERGVGLQILLGPNATPDRSWGFSASFGDYDRDGWLDLHTTEWRRTEGVDSKSRGRVRLLHNVGAAKPGYYEDLTELAGVFAGRAMGDTGWEVRAFTSAFSDLDDDGWPDLAIAGDYGTSRLFWNNGNGTFTDGTESADVSHETNGMGGTIGDHDGDGRLDWFVTSIYDPLAYGTVGNRLYRNLGARRFEDRTESAGVKDAAWGWGSAFFDADNDGDLDLVAVNGMDEAVNKNRFLTDPTRFWENRGPDASFVERALQTGIDDRSDGKAVIPFDFDRDGDIDLYVANHHGVGKLFRNDSIGGNALTVKLLTETGNRAGIGARLTAEFCGRQIVREVSASSTFLGQGEANVQLGTGKTGTIDRLKIRWPDGHETVTPNVATNQGITIGTSGAIVNSIALP